jgi:hypothetical protein
MMNTIELLNLCVTQSFEVNAIAKYFTLTFPNNARSKAVVVHTEIGF